MHVSPKDGVRRLYNATADSYDAMMGEEIRLPLYDRGSQRPGKCRRNRTGCHTRQLLRQRTHASKNCHGVLPRAEINGARFVTGDGTHYSTEVGAIGKGVRR